MFWAGADGKITRESFLQCYETNTKQGDQTHIRIYLFNNYGYRNDLRRGPKAKDKVDSMQFRDIKDMPRYKIGNNKA